MSEFSKESYRNEYGLLNLTYYLQKSKGSDLEKNLTLLKNILYKVHLLHDLNLPHLNLSTNNIFFNNNTNEVFLDPIKLENYEENELWYSAPELTFSYLSDTITLPHGNTSCDIWSIGCILAEIFFLTTPLFQSFSIRDKIRKMIEIMGIPKYEDVSDYMSIKEYELINKTYNIAQQYKPLIYELIDFNLRTANPFKRELYDLLFSCLNFNPDNRPTVRELIKRVTDLDDLSFNYVSKNRSTDRNFRKTEIEKNEEFNYKESVPVFKQSKFNLSYANYNFNQDSFDYLAKNSSRACMDETNTNYQTNDYMDLNLSKYYIYIYYRN
jgi:serine/threonine protein kinase